MKWGIRLVMAGVMIMWSLMSSEDFSNLARKLGSFGCAIVFSGMITLPIVAGFARIFKDSPLLAVMLIAVWILALIGIMASTLPSVIEALKLTPGESDWMFPGIILGVCFSGVGQMIKLYRLL